MKMQGNAKAKFDEIQADMDANNKRRKQLRVQIKKEEEHLEDLKKVRYPDFLSLSLPPFKYNINYHVSPTSLFLSIRSCRRRTKKKWPNPRRKLRRWR